MTNESGSDVVGHFRTGLDVLRQYPVTIAPPLLAQLVMAALIWLFVGGAIAAVAVSGGVGLVGAGFAFMLLTVLNGVLSLLAASVTLIMAREALAGREPSIGDAVSAVTARFGDVLVAAILVMIIVGGLAAIFFFLAGLPALIAAFFLIFTMPAVLLDGKSAVEGIKRSVTLVKDNLGPTVLFLVGCLVASVVIYLVARIIGSVPVLGTLARAVLAGIAIAYFSIVGVRVYQTLPRR